jgi:hypothetical protein
MEAISGMIPKQYIGNQTGATSRLKMDTRHEALLLFQAACKRLLDINNWKKICGNSGAEFALTDKEGEPLYGLNPEIGNLIRIKLPAPPNKEGDGFDWVRIEEFEDSRILLSDSETFGFRVRPVENPKNRTGNSAHFYTSDATSTFLIIRYSHTVFALERGKNEVPNDSDSWITKIRNKVVAIVAMIGFSKPQWQNLVDGLLMPPSLN